MWNLFDPTFNIIEEKAMKIRKYKSSRLISFILCWVLMFVNIAPAYADVFETGEDSIRTEETEAGPALNDLSEDSENDLENQKNGNDSEVELGFIFESRTEVGKDVFVQLGSETDIFDNVIVTYLSEGASLEKSPDDQIENIMAFHLSADAELVKISGNINGVAFDRGLDASDLEEEIVDVGDETRTDGGSDGVELYIAKDAEDNSEAIVEAADNASEQIPSLMSANSDKKIVVLDPGHSSVSTGASKTWNGILYREEVLTLKIAQYVKEALEQYGNVEVYLTRDASTNPSLYDRVKYASDLGADILVSIHLNAAGEHESNTTATGVEAMVAKIGSYNVENAKTGQDLARSILDRLVALGFKDRGFVFRMSDDTQYSDGSIADYYGIVRYGQEMNVPSIIVEHGFINNESDFNRFFSSEEGLRKLGVADAQGIADFLNLTQWEDGWHTDSEGHRIYVENGSIAKGWKTIEGARYYFDANGYAMTGAPIIDGKKYVFTETGEQIMGWFTILGMTLYFDPEDNGAAAVGIRVIADVVYYFNQDGVSVPLPVGSFEVNGKKYLVLESGKLYTGWIQLTSDWRLYYDPSDNGAAAIGIHKIDGKVYYFDGNGIMQRSVTPIIDGKKYLITGDGTAYTGWIQLTAEWRLYYDPADNGAAAVGIRGIDGKTYYFDENGIMLKSVAPTVNGKKYLITEDGSAYTGWIQLTIDWRLYYDPMDNGAAAVGIHKIDGKVYYFDENGIMQRSVSPIIDGKKYLITENGNAYTGWIQLNASWRLYYDPDDNGAAAVGFREIGGKTYYFDSNGVMQTQGSFEVSGKKYLAMQDGSLYMGWIQLNANWRLYYDPEDNGAAATGLKSIKDKTYYFDVNGVMQTGFVWVGSTLYYFEADGTAPQTGSYEMNGKKYLVLTNGSLYLGWIQLTADWILYYDPEDNGAAATGYRKIGNVLYYFNSDGVLIESEVDYIVDTDPLNGKQYRLEKQYLSDPQIGVDVTEDEFLASVIYSEAGNQGLAGQIGVGLVILNRMESDSYPDSLRFVIYAATQFEVARNGMLTKYLTAFRDNDESILYWIKKAETLQAVQSAKKIMADYKSTGKKRVVDGIEFPTGKDDFDYLGFMTPAAFERLNLDPVKSDSLTYKNTVFYKYWIKRS